MPRVNDAGGPQPQIIDGRISGGIDTKTDRKLVRSPNTLVAENVRYTTKDSIRKRLGTVGLPACGLQKNPGIGSTSDEVIALDDAALYALAPDGNSWARRGAVFPATLTQQNIASVALPAATPKLRSLTHDVIGNYGLAAWDLGGFVSGATPVDGMNSIVLTLFDVTTGKTIWTTTISRIFPASTSTYVHGSDTLASGYGVTNQAYATSVGVGFPIVKAFAGSFYLAFMSEVTGTATVTLPPGQVAGTTGNVAVNFWTVHWYRLNANPVANPPSFPVNGTPVNVDNLWTNARYYSYNAATTKPMPGGVAIASPATSYFNHFFDMVVNDYDITLIASGNSGSPPTKYGTVTLLTASLPWTSQGVTNPTPVVTARGSALSDLNLTAYTDGAPFTAAATPTTFTTPVPAQPSIVLAFNTPINLYVAFPSASANATQLAYKIATNPAVPVGVDDPSPSQNHPLFTALNVTGSPTGTSYELQYTDGAAFQRYTINTSARTFTSVFSGPVKIEASLWPANGRFTLLSRIFLSPYGQPMAWVLLGGDYSNNVIVLATIGDGVTPGVTFAHMSYLRASAAPAFYANAQVPNVVNGKMLLVNYADSTSTIAKISLVGVDFTPASAGSRIVPLAKGALILGADTKYYDGTTVRTLGWLKAPDVQPMSGTYSSGSLIPGVTYTYIGVFVDYDSYGNAMYSAPSSPAAVTIASGHNTALFYTNGNQTTGTGAILYIDPTAPYLPTVRGRLLLFRNSRANPTAYYQVPQLTYVSANTWADTSSEDLSGKALLYSPPSGGELPTDPPPASSFAVTNQRRPFLASAENTSWLYYGKPFYPGRVPEFNAQQYIDVDPTSGAITGLAVLDQNIIIFKKERIFVLGGRGPDATGSGTFNDTYAVATDTGCIDSGSIVTTQDGVYFRSYRGIELLDRTLSIQYVGAFVEGILGQNTVYDSVVVPAQNQVRFSLNNNTTIVLDTLLNRWSTYNYLNSSPIYQQTVFKGVPYMSTFYGGVYRYMNEDSATFVDLSAVPYNMRIESAWFPMAGLQGSGRIRRAVLLGDFINPHTLTLSFGYDYKLQTWDYALNYAATTATQQAPYQWRARAPRQVCMAVQLKLTDNFATNEACVITGLLLETLIKGGVARVPDTQAV